MTSFKSPGTDVANLGCMDCNERFDSPVFMGKVLSTVCPACRGRRVVAEEQDRQRRHVSSLAYHREQWSTDTVRGIPPKYHGLTWDDFRFDKGGEGNRRVVELLKEYAAGFPVDRRPSKVRSLLITRDVNGVGKTMLTCLVLKDIIMRYEETGRERCPFQFWTIDSVKLRLKSAERFGGAENVEGVYRDFGTMSLLALDDVGKEKLAGADASFSYEVYFNILNTRYNNELPVILTSNLRYEPWRDEGLTLANLMGTAGVSRLMEMTGGVHFEIAGEDRR